MEGTQQLVKLEDLNVANLSNEEKALVENYKSQIAVTDRNSIQKFGIEPQNQIASFSEQIISGTLAKNSGEVGTILVDMSMKLKGFDEALQEKKGLSKLFSSAKNRIARIKTEYTSVNKVIQNVEKQLTTHMLTMQNDVKNFDVLFEKNKELFYNTSLYIIAGKEKLKELKEVELPKLQKLAEETKDEMDAQNVKDMTDLINRLDKRIYDLELTKAISIQTAPQIRMLQSNDIQLSDKIQTSINITIPIWKTKTAICIGINNAKQALEAQQTVDQVTNDLFKSTAELLKQSTIEVARESEKGMIDIDTLKEVNTKLLETVDEVVQIHKQGEEARRQGEQELAQMSGELVKRLKEVND